MKKYNVGIIGYGWVATAHIPAINASPLAQVTAIYSSRPLDSAELSAKHGCPITAYDDLDQMLAEPFTYFTFSPAGAAVYQLGPFGTAAKKLKEWNLKR